MTRFSLRTNKSKQYTEDNNSITSYDNDNDIALIYIRIYDNQK